MYLEPDILAERLGRVTQRAQENNAEGLARKSEMATAKLSGSVAPPPRKLEMMPQPPREGERRCSGRFAIGAQIHARRIPGVNFEIPIDNVSATGCRLEMIEECAIGEDAIIRFPDLEPMGARVRWTLGMTAGLEFVRPIHPAVFGSLLDRLSRAPRPNA
jgi:hypothetical protein